MTSEKGTQTELNGERVKELEKKIEEQAKKNRELEIVISKKQKSRSWNDFYEWLVANVINSEEINGHWIKQTKISSYVSFTNSGQKIGFNYYTTQIKCQHLYLVNPSKLRV